MLSLNLLILLFTLGIAGFYIMSKLYGSYIINFKYIFIFFMVLLLLILLFQREKKTQYITNLPYKDMNYKKDVKLTVIIFYSPECRYSRDFIASEWKRFQDYINEFLSDSVEIQEINCLDIKNKNKCKKITSYPTIIINKYNKLYEFKSIRTVDNLVSFVEYHLN